VMILRLAASREVPPWQVVLSLAVLAAAVPATMWAAAKIFRTGVLMYGKPPKLREMLRWVKYR
jgi:ABC-2 type transport system permease protein